MDYLELLIIAALIVWVLIIVVNKSSQSPSSPTSSSSAKSSAQPKNSFLSIADKYTTYAEVQAALRTAGLESSNLIIGIDYTKSNEYTGRRTFDGKSLHHIDHDPKQVITCLGKTLEIFDDDKQIPAYGFGDITTADKKVFPFMSNRPCDRFVEVLEKYTEITPVTILSGPTSFAPIIHEAIRIVKEHNAYHILVIIADGQVTSERETKNAIVEASNYALSIVLVGVGDGPWDMMREFDDGLPTRKFDNFQFVNFTEFFRRQSEHAYPDIAFAVAALQEIPDQFKEIRRLKLL